MLKLTLYPEEYLTINGDVVIQLTRAAGGHADMAVHAPREFPILRGAVLERQGGQRPACLEPQKKKAKYYRDRYFVWNDDRERAVRAISRSLERLKEKGEIEEAAIIQKQLNRIIPPIWEDEITDL